MFTNQKIELKLCAGSSVTVKMDGQYFFGDSYRRLSDTWKLYVLDNKIFFEDDIEIIMSASDLVCLSPVHRKNTWTAWIQEQGDNKPCEKKGYEGCILIKKEEEQLSVSIEVEVEPYVKGILCKSYPKSTMLEYLKVQALLIRNAALLRALKKTDASQFQYSPVDSVTCNSSREVQYKNLDEIYVDVQTKCNPIAHAAVELTRGMALVYEGKITNVLQSLCKGQEKGEVAKFNWWDEHPEQKTDALVCPKNSFQGSAIDDEKPEMLISDPHYNEANGLCNGGALEMAQCGKTMHQIIKYYLPQFQIEKQY